MLERAMRELEKVVAESRLSTMEVQDIDASSTTIKRRLPCEVKQKLAKVARLAHSSQGKISKELINKLMNILGHSVQLRTLKHGHCFLSHLFLVYIASWEDVAKTKYPIIRCKGVGKNVYNAVSGFVLDSSYGAFSGGKALSS
ncbi:hypothetical protein Gotur_009722 [Gossypium turneri]